MNFCVNDFHGAKKQNPNLVCLFISVQRSQSNILVGTSHQQPPVPRNAAPGGSQLPVSELGGHGKQYGASSFTRTPLSPCERASRPHKCVLEQTIK
jgi:hypothetical protein